MAATAPCFTAVTTSARQILTLLRCISFARVTQVLINQDGIRFTAENGSIMEASVFLDKILFSSYTCKPSSISTGSEPPEFPLFEVNLNSLVETLNIFSLSDPNLAKSRLGAGGEYDAFAAHRLRRHAGVNAFSHPAALGVSGTCTLTYDGPGSPLSIHMAEAGVTTSCDLTTYEADSLEDIPFNRDGLALKTILRSSLLLDAVAELSNMSPSEVTLAATPGGRSAAGGVSLSASGALGSATVDFAAAATAAAVDTPMLETFQCAAPARATFQLELVKAAQRAMAAASKVSVRLDDAGVLSLQFLVEIDPANSAAAAGGAGGHGTQGLAFVDFRLVPLVEDGERSDTDSDSSEG